MFINIIYYLNESLRHPVIQIVMQIVIQIVIQIIIQKHP